MRYMLIIRNGENHPQPGDAQWDQLMADYGAFSEGLAAHGTPFSGDPLAPPDTATTVRVVDGEVLMTDGPFAETKEWFSGYYILDVESLDQALMAAGMVPSAQWGSVEVRPVMDM
jgi:hypothetical protein